MRQDAAETVALQALGWLAGHEELLPVFQSATGVGEADMRARAGEAEFLGAVLDFLMMDDAWVMEFCQALDLPYETPAQARRWLPGGAEVNWT